MKRAMKDSGVEWIGQVPEGWKRFRLKHLITSRNGGNWGAEPDDQKGENIVCLRIADFDYQRSRFKKTSEDELTKRNYDRTAINNLRLKEGDVLIEKSGGGDLYPVGRAVIFDKEYRAVYSNFMDRIRLTDYVNPFYFTYYWRAMYDRKVTWLYIKQTIGIQNLSLTQLLDKQKFLLPPLPEQERIAKYLDKVCGEVDGLVEKTEKEIAALEAYKKSVITEAVTGKDEKVKVRGEGEERAMKDSGVEWIGQVPEEWGIVALKHIATIRTGSTPTDWVTREYDEKMDLLWIKSDDLGTFCPITSSAERIRFEGRDSARLFPPMTIYVCCIGSIGKCGFCLTESTCNQQINALNFNSCVEWKFGFYQTFALKHVYEDSASGNVLKILNINRQGYIKYVLPPLPVQRQIVAHLDKVCGEVDGTIEKCRGLIAKLKDYKKSLIFECVTGKREVAA